MTLTEAIENRHAVRSYTNKKIEGETLSKLQEVISECNIESGLNIQLVKDEPTAFAGAKAKYGKFSGVTNYLALVGPKGMDEEIGYYGEKIVLAAQQLGLNTCWVALTFDKVKGAYEVKPGQKLYIVVSIGYGENQGVTHKTKSPKDVSHYDGQAPDWFKAGVRAALLAPTAMNQQKFKFIGKDRPVAAKADFGFYTKIDLGIAKYHFEIGAGTENFDWA